MTGLAATFLLMACSIGPAPGAAASSPRPSTPASAGPPPSPSPTTAAAPAGPPPSAPAIYFLDSNGHMLAATWDGTVVDVGAGMRRMQSPDGSRYVEQGGNVLASDGSAVGSVPRAKPPFSWADDSRHLCSVHYDSPSPPADDSVETPTVLYAALPGSSPTAVLQVGYLRAQSGPQLLACSFGKGLATVAEICVMAFCDLWTVDLLNHRVLYHRGRSAPPAGSGQGYPVAVSSADATLVAIGDSGGSETIILSSTDGEVITRLPFSRLVAFTADDRFALVEHPTGPAQLVDWRAGRAVVTLPGTRVQAALAEPGGSRLAVALGDPGATSSGYPAPAELVIVGGEGQLASIARAVQPMF